MPWSRLELPIKVWVQQIEHPPVQRQFEGFTVGLDQRGLSTQDLGSGVYQLRTLDLGRSAISNLDVETGHRALSASLDEAFNDTIGAN